jgi:hypothetical protein
MKPHRLQETKKSRALSLVRMHLKASLGWLEGFPSARKGPREDSRSGGDESLVWFVPAEPRSATTMVDKALVIRAGRTVRELSGEFPEALASAVGDVPTFVAGVTRVLTRVQLALRDGLGDASPFELDDVFGPEAKKTARGIASRLPVLAPTIRALGFLGLMKPREAVRSLARLARDADRYAEASRRLERMEKARTKPGAEGEDTHGTYACRVWSMLEMVRRSQPSATAFLEDALLDPVSYEVPLAGGANAARALSASLGRLAKREPGPVPSTVLPHEAILAPTLVEALRAVLEHEPAIQKRVLELFARLEPLEAARSWKPFYDELDALAARAHSLGTSVHAVRRSATGKNLANVDTSGITAAVIKVDTLTRKAPPDAHPERWLEAVLALGRTEHRDIVSELERVLTLVPAEIHRAHLRAGLCEDVAYRFAVYDDEDRWRKILREFLEAFRKTLTARAPDVQALLAPFAESYARGVAYSRLTRSVLDHLERPGSARIFFAVLDRKTRPGCPAFDEKLTLSLARVCASAPDESRATMWFEALQRCASASVYVPPEILSFAATLAERRPECFEELLVKLKVLDLDSRDTNRLRRWLGEEHHVVLVREALLDGHGALVKAALVRMEALGHAGLPPVEPEPLVSAASPGTFLDFPEELRASMARVAQLSASPALTLGKLLGPAFRSREDLTQELEALRKKRLVADAPALARRESALASRLTAPPERHSPEKLARLVTKLELAAKRQRLEHWIASLDQRASARLSEMLGVPMDEPRLSKESTRECLLAVFKLEPKTRALAKTVLSRRFGEGPWDLRDHPENARFVASLEKRGAAMTPWLDGIGARKERLPDGRDIVLSLESDPLEILEMGRHFDTCLSPGAFNYFSVFSNLADIDKRVIYARDTEGRVVARCLLGLTAEGGIVTFHAYRHGTFDFGAMVARFAGELSSRMGVVVVARGSVPLLVASDWYDDGPVDLGGRLPYLLEGSALRTALATVPVEGLESLLEAHLAPLALNELTLPTLLDLPEIGARPELGVGFVTLARARGLDRLPEHVVLRLADLLHAAGRHDLVDEGWVLAAARRASSSDHGLPDRVLRKLAELFPSGTLALLRETRPRGVRSLADEYQGSRLVAAAEAMRALARERKAVDLYARAVRAGLSKEDRTLCRARMAKLKRGMRVRRRAE